MLPCVENPQPLTCCHPIGDIVKGLRFRELLVDERDGVAPGREHAREVLRRGRRGVEKIRRN